MDESIVIEGAFVKAMNVKMGKGILLTLQAPFKPETARELGVFSEVFRQDNSPKQNLLEAKLRIESLRAPFDFKLELGTRNADDLLITDCAGSGDWMSILQGASRKGKPTKLMLQWKVLFLGSGVQTLAWLEKWRSAPGKLTLKSTAPEQTTFDKPDGNGKVKQMPKQETMAAEAGGPVQ